MPHGSKAESAASQVAIRVSSWVSGTRATLNEARLPASRIFGLAPSPFAPACEWARDKMLSFEGKPDPAW